MFQASEPRRHREGDRFRHAGHVSTVVSSGQASLLDGSLGDDGGSEAISGRRAFSGVQNLEAHRAHATQRAHQPMMVRNRREAESVKLTETRGGSLPSLILARLDPNRLPLAMYNELAGLELDRQA
ncbi:unnamed protein product [Victoria cruziana]